MKVESPDEAFEETRRKCFLTAKLMVLVGHLKYHKDPVGMLRDLDHTCFAEPFRDYCLNVIPFKEAQRQLNEIRLSVISQASIAFHDDILRVKHRKKTGRDFDSDLADVKGSDKKIAQESAINLVKSFKSSYSKNPVRDVVLKAATDGDENFWNAIADVKVGDRTDAKRNLKLIEFVTFNREFLNDPELSEAEVLRLARKQGALPDMVTEESFCRYLRNQGIRMKSKTQIRKEKFEVLVSPSVEKKLESKKNKFATYLFGNFTLEQVSQEIQKIKQSLFPKANLS